MITVTCPKCNAAMNCDDSAAGQVVKCYACQNDIVVPASKAAAPVFEAAAPAAPAAAQSSNILKFAGWGVGALIVAVFAAVIVFAISGCSDKDEYIEWMNGELALKDKGAVYRNVESELNGATIKNIELKSCEESSDISGDYVTFKLNVGWQGKYNTSGSVEIDQIYKVIDGRLDFYRQHIVSADNPDVDEYCRAVGRTFDDEVICKADAVQRKRIEENQKCTVTKAYTSGCYVETFGNSKDTGINGSNIDKIGIEFRMDVKRDGKDYYTDLGYVYRVRNGKWEYFDSGVTKTNVPQTEEAAAADNIDWVEVLPLAIYVLMML